MSIRAKIVSIESRAQHEGKVFTQGVLIEPCAGDRIWVNDQQLLVTEEQLGETHRLELSPTFNIPEIEQAQNAPRRITTADESSPKDHLYSGVLEKIEPGPAGRLVGGSLLLNVGCGSVRFEIRKEPEIEISEGEYLVIPALRTDIVECL